MGEGGEAGRRADRCGHLHGVGDTGFPRSSGRVDPGSGGREALRHPLLRGRPGDPPQVVEVATRPPGLERAAKRRPPRDRGARAPGEAPRAHHPEHRRAAPEGGQFARARDRGARHRACGGLPLVRVERTDAVGARPGPQRRARSAVRALRRDPEKRYHLVRAGARARGDRSRDGRRRGSRSVRLDRHQPAGLPDRRGGPRGKAGGRARGHRQRAADASGRDGGCGASRRDRGDPGAGRRRQDGSPLRRKQEEEGMEEAVSGETRDGKRRLWERLLPLRHWLGADAAGGIEAGQAWTRIMCTVLGLAGLPLIGTFEAVPAAVVTTGLLFLLYGVVYLALVHWRPVPTHGRRGVAVVLDCLANVYIASFGGPFAAYVGFLFLVTIGWGLRFGRHYLFLATAIVLAGMAA